MFHIAQVNIAQLQAKQGSPVVQGFFDNIDQINKLAERSKGFIWRFEDDYYSDPLMVFNLSVWESIEDLAQFVYRTAHVEIMRRKSDWMTPLSQAHTTLWWVEKGTLPSGDEAIARLETLRQHGPTEQAFSFAERYPQPNKTNS